MDMFLVSFSPMFVLREIGVAYSFGLLIVASICLIICKTVFRKKVENNG